MWVSCYCKNIICYQCIQKSMNEKMFIDLCPFRCDKQTLATRKNHRYYRPSLIMQEIFARSQFKCSTCNGKQKGLANLIKHPCKASHSSNPSLGQIQEIKKAFDEVLDLNKVVDRDYRSYRDIQRPYMKKRVQAKLKLYDMQKGRIRVMDYIADAFPQEDKSQLRFVSEWRMFDKDYQPKCLEIGQNRTQRREGEISLEITLDKEELAKHKKEYNIPLQQEPEEEEEDNDHSMESEQERENMEAHMEMDEEERIFRLNTFKQFNGQDEEQKGPVIQGVSYLHHENDEEQLKQGEMILDEDELEQQKELFHMFEERRLQEQQSANFRSLLPPRPISKEKQIPVDFSQRSLYKQGMIGMSQSAPMKATREVSFNRNTSDQQKQVAPPLSRSRDSSNPPLSNTNSSIRSPNIQERTSQMLPSHGPPGLNAGRDQVYIPKHRGPIEQPSHQQNYSQEEELEDGEISGNHHRRGGGRRNHRGGGGQGGRGYGGRYKKNDRYYRDQHSHYDRR
ncbi:hypothetical protein FGO68_gene8083 [Halteria grandinella]|uniref:Uncharacterized protein n=1 Tax=Halteria grandinella TaxID=5974 RepID=A0A8J8NRU9_HALGN|nr:hypothetical protein FGO68_gene8083 [Halteria grandinella]